MIKAIETQYKGCRFRSRLEARWAIFLDTLGIEWQYEREGYDLGSLGYYLPDFWLPWNGDGRFPGGGYFLEIKGQEPTAEEIAKLKALTAGTGHTSLMFAGEPGKYKRYEANRRGLFSVGDPAEMAQFVDGDPYAHELWITFSRWDFIGQVDAAIVAARSARFEYGETPKPPMPECEPDVIESYEITEDAQATLAVKVCPACGAIPYMYSNRTSPMMDKWVACPECGLSGEHDDSFRGAYLGWDKAASLKNRKPHWL